MNPKNVEVLTCAQIDGVMLANNHVFDWEYEGFIETLDTLQNQTKIKIIGAGRNSQEAKSPQVFEVENKGRVLVWGIGHESSGVPKEWSAK